MVKYIGFYLYHRSCYLWSPVIVSVQIRSGPQPCLGGKAAWNLTGLSPDGAPKPDFCSPKSVIISYQYPF